MMKSMDQRNRFDETDVTEDEFDVMFDAGQPIDLAAPHQVPPSYE